MLRRMLQKDDVIVVFHVCFCQAASGQRCSCAFPPRALLPSEVLRQIVTIGTSKMILA